MHTFISTFVSSIFLSLPRIYTARGGKNAKSRGIIYIYIHCEVRWIEGKREREKAELEPLLIFRWVSTTWNLHSRRIFIARGYHPPSSSRSPYSFRVWPRPRNASRLARGHSHREHRFFIKLQPRGPPFPALHTRRNQDSDPFFPPSGFFLPTLEFLIDLPELYYKVISWNFWDVGSWNRCCPLDKI